MARVHALAAVAVAHCVKAAIRQKNKPKRKGITLAFFIALDKIEINVYEIKILFFGRTRADRKTP